MQERTNNTQYVVIVYHIDNISPTVYGYFNTKGEAIDWMYQELPLRNDYWSAYAVPVTSKQ